MKKWLKAILMVSWHYLNGTCGKLKGHGKRRAKDTTLFYYSSGRDCSNGGVVMAVEGKIKFCLNCTTAWIVWSIFYFWIVIILALLNISNI